MKCAYHADITATAECSRCGAPLCEKCAGVTEKAQSVVCSRCAALDAAKEMSHAADERVIEKERLREEKESRGKRSVWLKRALILSVVAAVVAANIVLYFMGQVQVGKQIDLSENPVAAAVILDSAIQDYAESHGGAFPARLEDLLGTYLQADEIGPDDLAHFIYSRPTEHSYELRIKAAKEQAHEEIVFQGGQ